MGCRLSRAARPGDQLDWWSNVRLSQVLLLQYFNQERCLRNKSHLLCHIQWLFVCDGSEWKRLTWYWWSSEIQKFTSSHWKLTCATHKQHRLWWQSKFPLLRGWSGLLVGRGATWSFGLGNSTRPIQTHENSNSGRIPHRQSWLWPRALSLARRLRSSLCLRLQ